jgi:hypothetical protein
MAGGHKYYPILLNGAVPVSYTLYRNQFLKSNPATDSSNPNVGKKKKWKEKKTSNDGQHLEANFCASFVIASHYGGIGGTLFSEFLPSLMFQLGLGDARQFEPVVESLPPSITGCVVPFLSVPSSEWPVELVTAAANLGWKIVNLDRPGNKDIMNDGNNHHGVDLITYTMKETSTEKLNTTEYLQNKDLFEISGECKDHTKPLGRIAVQNILDRIPKPSKIHIVATNDIADSMKKTKDEANLQASYGRNFRVIKIQKRKETWDCQSIDEVGNPKSETHFALFICMKPKE